MLHFSLFSKKAQKAFSLIEMMLTILIVAFLFGFSSQYFKKKERKVKSVFEEFVRLNKRLVSLSSLRASSYRLVFELSLDKPDSWWVEKKKKTGNVLGRLSEDLKNKTSNSSEADLLDENFEIDTSFYLQPKTLPSFLDITEVEVKKSSKLEGKVFIDYNSSPIAQEVKIKIFRPDNQARWTLYLDPVSKQLKLLQQD